MKWIKFSVLEIGLAVALTLALIAAIGMAVELSNISAAMGVGHGVGRYMARERAICEAASNKACVVRAIGVPVDSIPDTGIDFIDGNARISVGV